MLPISSLRTAAYGSLPMLYVTDHLLSLADHPEALGLIKPLPFPADSPRPGTRSPADPETGTAAVKTDGSRNYDPIPRRRGASRYPAPVFHYIVQYVAFKCSQI